MDDRTSLGQVLFGAIKAFLKCDDEKATTVPTRGAPQFGMIYSEVPGLSQLFVVEGRAPERLGPLDGTLLAAALAHNAHLTSLDLSWNGELAGAAEAIAGGEWNPPAIKTRLDAVRVGSRAGPRRAMPTA